MPSLDLGGRVALVGGGIGGLAAAAFLWREGIRATIYEQAPALTEVGAGLILAPNVIRLLRQLDGFPRLMERAVALDVGWEFRRWRDGQVLSAEDLSTRCEELYGERSYAVHRADVVDAIRCSVPDQFVRLGARCLGIEARENSVRVHLDDGTYEDAAILLGADGMHSVVRNAIAPQAQPRPSGLCAFRALVPSAEAPEFARRAAHTLWLGPGRHLVHYPISGGDVVNVVAFAPSDGRVQESWSATATSEEFLGAFQGWDRRLTDLIDAAGAPGRWAVLDRTPLEQWTRGRITLLGDAAHPMFPFFAQGAGQAIEDAATVALCLAADPRDPHRALHRYERLRIGRTTRMQQASRARATVNHLPDGPEQVSRDAELGNADALAASGWIYGHDVVRSMSAVGAP